MAVKNCSCYTNRVPCQRDWEQLHKLKMKLETILQMTCSPINLKLRSLEPMEPFPKEPVFNCCEQPRSGSTTASRSCLPKYLWLYSLTSWLPHKHRISWKPILENELKVPLSLTTVLVELEAEFGQEKFGKYNFFLFSLTLFIFFRRLNTVKTCSTFSSARG